MQLRLKAICIGVVMAGVILGPRMTHGAMTMSPKPTAGFAVVYDVNNIPTLSTGPMQEGCEMNDVISEVRKGVEGMVSAQKAMEADVKAIKKDHEEMQSRIFAIDGYLSTKRGGPGFSMPGSDARFASSEKSPSGERAVNLFKIAAAQCLLKEGKDAWKMVDGEYEKSIVEQATQKAIDTGTGGSGGGFVVPSKYLSEQFIEVLRSKSVVYRAGATELADLTGKPTVIPKQISSGSVTWLGENSTIPLSDPTFGQVQLTPKTMAMRNQYSRLMDILANPKALDLIQRDFAATAALELDRAALIGSGTANQPTGVVNVAGILSYAIGANGGSLSLDDLYGLVGALEDNNAFQGKIALITHPKALRKLKKQRIAQFSGDTGGSYAIQPLLTDEALSAAIGLTCLTTTQLPTNLTKGSSTDCTQVFLGNFEELLIGTWGGIEILATNVGGNAWAQNAIEVRLVQNVDFQVRHPQSFALCVDARTL